MSRFSNLLIQFGNSEFDCGAYNGVEFYEAYTKARQLEKELVERDRKLLEALKRVASGVDVDHSARIAVDALKNIGEEY